MSLAGVYLGLAIHFHEGSTLIANALRLLVYRSDAG